MTEFFALIPRKYSYLIDDSDEKKVKTTKKCVIKVGLKFKVYNKCLEPNRLEIK